MRNTGSNFTKDSPILAVGFIVGLTGVGGGSLMTPVLVILGLNRRLPSATRALAAATLSLIYPRLPAVSIVGTDLAHAAPLTAVAGLGHAHLGTVDFVLLGSLLVGSLPGINLGSHLGVRLPEHIIRPILASMLLIIGVRFTFSF